MTIDEGTEYQLGLELRDNEVKANLYTKHGKKLAETKAVSDATYESGYVGFYTGGAGSGATAYYDYVTSETILHSTLAVVSERQKVAEEALNTTMAQEVLAELNNPSTTTSGAERENVYKNRSALEASFIRVPMEYGEIHVGYNNGSVTVVKANLDRSKMSSSLISDLSGDFDWPSGTEASILHIQNYDAPKFVRTVTGSEESDLSTTVYDYDSRDDVPINTIVMNNDGGFYRVLHYDISYHVDSARSTVKEDVKILGSQDECVNDTKDCMVGIGGVSISCGSVPIACAGAVLSPLPGDEIGCAFAAAGCGYSSWSTNSDCVEARDECEN